ncbi:type IV toxin-antitoxin system AbiEi family antitoxin domain-containing protein [Capnocytophaga canis]|uniref:type IV toxin-antitoxin system AbiEi family antitoxin domain-containing protein n=1 Tax=Capnocytophaga canis TaxID=1848903 RepID=UPI001562E5E9|nr:type IV toxin-antitoxin system AbiEi family antitoxin domain-containing protein [Capnocytophaga canis]
MLDKNRRRLLEKTLPEGIVVSRKWLENTLHLQKHAIDNLVKSEYLKSVHKGYYVRGMFLHSWQAMVYTLQHYMQTDLVVGGINALQLQDEYLPCYEVIPVQLYGETTLPSWLKTIGVLHRFTKYSSRAVYDEFDAATTAMLTTLYTWREELQPLRISCKEKAFLEFLLHVSDEQSFKQAVTICQQMNASSMEKWQLLLEKCVNVKIKRLFLWLVSQYQPTWLNHLDLSKVYLGSGNRVIVKNGRLDTTYHITVPK